MLTAEVLILPLTFKTIHATLLEKENLKKKTGKDSRAGRTVKIEE